MPARLAARVGGVDRRLMLGVFAAVQVLVSVGWLASRDPFGGLAFCYLWVVPFAWCLLSWRAAGLLIGWTALSAGATLEAFRRITGVGLDRHPLQYWAIVVGTALLLGLLVRALVAARLRTDLRAQLGFEASPVGLAVITEEAVVTEANPAFAQMLGMRRQDVPGISVADLLPPESPAGPAEPPPDRPDATYEPAHSAAEVRRQDQVRRRGDGSVIVLDVAVTTQPASTAGTDQSLLQLVDVTAERTAAVAERISQESLSRRVVQQQVVARLGEQLLGADTVDDLVRAAIAALGDGLHVRQCAVLRAVGDGQLRRLRPEPRAGNQPAGSPPAGEPSPAGGFPPVDGGLSPTAGALIADPEYTLAGDVLLTGRSRRVDDIAAAGFRPLRHARHASGVAAPVRVHGRVWGVLAAFASRPEAFDDQDLSFIQSVGSVVSAGLARLAAEERLRHEALHDRLTGLGNRTLALDRLGHALDRIRPDGGRVALVNVDVDNFALVNDSLGHGAGDDLLAVEGAVLRTAVRPQDTVARLGADEFVAVCEDVDEMSALLIAEHMRSVLSAPIVVRGQELSVSASIGVALSDGGSTAETMLREATGALQLAKQRGKGRVELHQGTPRGESVYRLQMEADLRRAVEQDQLRVVYQPIVSLRTGQVDAVEALARWQHPVLGLVPPEEFIPLAESIGLIEPIGAQVMRQACRALAALADLHSELSVTVNVSPRQLVRSEFVGAVAGVLRETGVPASRLGLEVTESVLLDANELSRGVIGALRELGVQLVLDDFGTGYSSLAYLARFPMDALKIDRSFVAGLGRHAESSAIVSAIVTMAGSLSLRTVAEGVETPRQLAMLAELGCDSVQGFLLAAPSPLDDLRDVLRSWDSSVALSG